MTQTQSLRERICRLLDGSQVGHHDWSVSARAIESIVRSERAAERERCKQAVKAMHYMSDHPHDAAAIDAAVMAIAALEDEP